MYLPETNVLVTRFLSGQGVGEVVDFMPVQNRAGSPPRHEIIRIVRGVRGSVSFRLLCHPAFDYARAAADVDVEGHVAYFSAPGIRMALVSPLELKRTDQGVQVDFVLRPNETATFVLQHLGDSVSGIGTNLQAYGDEALQETIAVWKNWVARCRYKGRWREMVIRSALVLKLLTFAPTGAIVAAATCSLPEEMGGSRNWDYRYTWMRDAAFTIYAFLRLGYTEEATS
jgi:GH15 family glucan-1,4-alpha-glucosidase